MNIPQLEYAMIKPKIGICLWGRGTGKTEGPGAIHTHEALTEMPRSNNGVMSTTYDKVLNTVIPSLQMTWEKFGWIENKHYWIRKYAPEAYSIDKPFRAPAQAHHLVHAYTGACLRLISLDRPGLSNGISIDTLFGDEAKFFKRDRVRELFPAIRGGAAFFGHLPIYGRILFTTDLPEDPDHWLFDYEKKIDKEAVSLILAIEKQYNKLIREIIDTKSDRKKQTLAKKLADYKKEANELRKNLIYISYATTLDNIHALGFSVLENFYLSLTQLEYDRSVLSDRSARSGNLFYANFRDELQPIGHGYHSLDEDAVDNLTLRDKYNGEGIKADCRWYKDFNYTEPLEIALDYNNRINWVVTGQEVSNEFRILTSQFVESPNKLKDLAKLFDIWWKHKKQYSNQIIYYYDHTAIAETPSTDISSSQEFIYSLTNLGWDVQEVYIGKALAFSKRFLLTQSLMDYSDNRVPNLAFNLSTNEKLIHTMKHTKTITTGLSFSKDKSSEKSTSKVEPSSATHNTEAFDTLVSGKYQHHITYNEGGLILST